MEKINTVIIGSGIVGNGILSIINELMGVEEMNPDYERQAGYYTDLINEYNFAKQDKLKQSQMYKKSNQKHPAFKRRGR